MQPFTEKFNDFLVAIFHNILRIEEEYLQNGIGRGLTIREMHMIEYIGKSELDGRTLSETADFLKIARPSVTVAARKLEEKGYLLRSACANDKRVVRVTLTREGRKVYRHHMRFHTRMVRELEAGLSEEEKKFLVRVIAKVDRFFDNNIEATT